MAIKTILYRIYNIINFTLLFLLVISFFSGISSIINYVVLGCMFVVCIVCNVIYRSQKRSENIIIQKSKESFQEYINRKKLRQYEIRVWNFGCDDIPHNKLFNVCSYIAIILFFGLLIVFSILRMPWFDFDFKIIDDFYKIDAYEYLISIGQRIFPLLISFAINKSTLNVLWYIYGANKSE